MLTEEERDADIDTVGGLVFTLAGRVPARGELICHPSGLEFRVLDADPRRIRRLRVRRPGAAGEPATAGGGVGLGRPGAVGPAHWLGGTGAWRDRGLGGSGEAPSRTSRRGEVVAGTLGGGDGFAITRFGLLRHRPPQGMGWRGARPQGAPRMPQAFKGKPPGGGAGEMSHRTAALRPAIALTPAEASRARALRRKGANPEAIAARFGVPMEEVEKALVQMRSRRPETTRGTLNVTLDAHRFVLAERRGEEPLWVTMDRLVDELIRLRATEAGAAAARRRGRAAAARAEGEAEMLPGLLR